MEFEFSAPHNWCDSRCWRCPVAGACRVQSAPESRRSKHVAAAEDPDDPSVVMADVEANLTRAIVMLHQRAAEEGVSFDDLDEPLFQPSEQTKRVLEAGRAYVVAVHELTRGLTQEGAEAADSKLAALVFNQAGLVYAKLARLFGQREAFSAGQVYREDSVPNLLLIEYAEPRVAWGVSRVIAETAASPTAYLSARHALLALLRPELEAIPAELRYAFARRVATCTAPSPFCTIGRAGGAAPH